MPRLRYDDEVDRLLDEVDESVCLVPMSVVARRLSVEPHVEALTVLTDEQGGFWAAGPVVDGVQPVSTTPPGRSRGFMPGTVLRTRDGVEVRLVAEEVCRAGGLYNTFTRDWERDASGERLRCEDVVTIDLQESQLDFFRWYAVRLRQFRERQKPTEFVAELLDNRRGGKTYGCSLAIFMASVDCPMVDGKRTVWWVITQTIPARDEIDGYLTEMFPATGRAWATFREMPKREWTFLHGSKILFKTGTDPERGLKVGLADGVFLNEACLLPELAYDVTMRALQDHQGFMILATNRPSAENYRGNWVVRLWDNAQAAVRDGKQSAVRCIRVPPSMNTTISADALTGISQAIMMAKPDGTDESILDEGLAVGAGLKLMAPPWDDAKHHRPLPDVGYVDVTGKLTEMFYGTWLPNIAGHDYQKRCAGAIYKLLAPGGDIARTELWCTHCWYFPDSGDENDLADIQIEHGFTGANTLIVADCSGATQNGAHHHHLPPSWEVLQRRGLRHIIGPTEKVDPNAAAGRNPGVDVSMMRMKKFIASDRFFVVRGTDAQRMQHAMKNCEAYRTRQGDLKVKGQLGHIVDIARYPIFWLTRKLAEMGDNAAMMALPPLIGKPRRLAGR